MDVSPRQQRSPSPSPSRIQAHSSPLRKSITLNESDIDSEMKHWEEYKIKGRKVTRRSYHSAVFHGKNFYIYGGYESNTGILSDFLTADLNPELPAFEWRDAPVKSEVKPGVRSRHTALVYQDKMYLFGGQTNSVENTDKFMTYDFNTQEWEALEPIKENPIPRIDSHQALLWDKGTGNVSMIVVGGFIGGKDGGYSNAVYEYEFSENKWRTLFQNKEVNNEDNPNPTIPQGRMSLGAAINRDILYIFGGIEGNTKMNDLWKFDLKEKKWTLIPVSTDLVPEPRNGHTLTCYKDCLILFGGILDVAHEKNDIFIFNIPKNIWQSVEKDTRMIFENSMLEPASPSPKKRNESPNNTSKSPYRRKRTISPKRFLFTKPETVSMESSEDGSPISGGGAKIKSSFAGQSIQENGPRSPEKYTKLVLNESPPRADSPNDTEAFSPTTKMKMKSQYQSTLEVKNLKSKLIQKMNLLKQFEVSEDKKEEFKMITPTLEAMKKSIESLGFKPDEKTDTAILKTLAALEYIKASVEKATDDGKSIKVGLKPMARDGHTATILDDKLFIFAGDRHKISFNDLFALNLNFLDIIII